MYGSNQVPERQFLKQMVVREHNFQTGEKLDWEKTIIYSIPPAPGFTHTWEVNTNQPGDTLRLHLCVNLEITDSIGAYELELKPCFRIGQLGDEAFVYRGSIDKAHTLYRGYKFEWLTPDLVALPVLIQTNDEPFALVDGSFIAIA